jgi:hypothetical protein
MYAYTKQAYSLSALRKTHLLVSICIICSPLSRQDLVTWKVALDRHQLSTIDKEALQKESGFVDVDQIQEDAWPALMADLTAAKPSIIASAFGMLPFYLPFFPR